MTKTKTNHARAAISIDGDIGKKGVKPTEFINQLNAIEANHIDLNITSKGGSVLGSVAIKTAIKKHPAYVVAHIDSIAGSIATEVALGADEIRIAEDAYIMIHNPSATVEGDADELRRDADVLDKMAKGMSESYAAKMGITPKAALALMKAETWYRGQEAVDVGYADSVYSGTHAVASFDPSRFTAKAPRDVVSRFTSQADRERQAVSTARIKARRRRRMGIR